jgi:aspartyl aminopeptidase
LRNSGRAAACQSQNSVLTKFEEKKSIVLASVIATFLSVNTDDENLKQFNQNVLDYLKEKITINVEDFIESKKIL